MYEDSIQYATSSNDVIDVLLSRWMRRVVSCAFVDWWDKKTTLFLAREQYVRREVEAQAWQQACVCLCLSVCVRERVSASASASVSVSVCLCQ